MALSCAVHLSRKENDWDKGCSFISGDLLAYFITADVRQIYVQQYDIGGVTDRFADPFISRRGSAHREAVPPQEFRHHVSLGVIVIHGENLQHFPALLTSKLASLNAVVLRSPVAILL